MELDPQNAISAFKTGIRQASALVVTYSFSVIGAILLLIIGFVVAGLVERWVYAGLGQVGGFDLTLRRFFSKIARYVVLGLVVVMVLGQFGIQTASVIAAIGAVGLAIGLALQGTLQNIAAGIHAFGASSASYWRVCGSRQCKWDSRRNRALCDAVTSGGRHIRSCAKFDALDFEPVKNFTRNGVRRNDITITVSNEDDIDQVQKSLLELAESDKRIKKDPAPSAFVAELDESRSR